MRRRTETKTPGSLPPADAFADALRDDASRLRAELSPEFVRRLEAALARTGPLPSAPASAIRPGDSLARPWFAGSLAGVALAAAAVLLLVGRPDGGGPDGPLPPPATPDADLAAATAAYVRMFELEPLRAETAMLTAPLEEELRDLKSDLDRARENVERDLGMTF